MAIDKGEVYRSSGGRCWYCGKQTIFYEDRLNDAALGDVFTVDHIIPISAGGNDDLVNLRCACFSCNAAKKNKSVEEYRRQIARKMIGAPVFSEKQLEWMQTHYGLSVQKDVDEAVQSLYLDIVFWGETE